MYILIWALISTATAIVVSGLLTWKVFGDHGHCIFPVDPAAHDAIVELLIQAGRREIGTIANPPRRTLFADGLIIASGEGIDAPAISFKTGDPAQAAKDAHKFLADRGLYASKPRHPDPKAGQSLAVISIPG